MSTPIPHIITGKPTPEQLSYLQRLNVTLATPGYGNQCFLTHARAVSSTLEFAAKCNLKFRWRTLGNESLIQRGRNSLAHLFMTDPALPTHLFFIDSDIVFNPGSVFELLLADKEVIGGIYPKKCINWDAAAFALRQHVPLKQLGHCAGEFVLMPKNTQEEVKIHEPWPVCYVGTGFCCIKRSTFLTFQAAYPDQWYRNNHMGEFPIGSKIWAYFDCGIKRERNKRGKLENHVYLSEDYWFCHKLLQAKQEIFAAPWVPLEHYGTYGFNGCLFCSQGTLIHNLGQPAVITKKAAK